MSTRSLTTTSYALLGLLAIQPWATYDLAKLMGRSLHFFWPRAESNLYAEPKRLVDAGLASAHEEWHGDRKRTVYSITGGRPRGASRPGSPSPSAPPRLESEPHLRVLYANYGTKDDLPASIERVETDAEASLEHFDRLLGEYARGRGALSRANPRQYAHGGARGRPVAGGDRVGALGAASRSTAGRTRRRRTSSGRTTAIRAPPGGRPL